MPTYNAVTKKYKCSTTETTTPVCCSCSRVFQPLGFPGATQAEGNILRPVYAIDAAIMQPTTSGDGVVCAPQSDIMMAQFNGGVTSTITMTVPGDAKGLDVYQIFDVLAKRGIFKKPL